jgi:hypothetical protein
MPAQRRRVQQFPIHPALALHGLQPDPPRPAPRITRSPNCSADSL